MHIKNLYFVLCSVNSIYLIFLFNSLLITLTIEIALQQSRASAKRPLPTGSVKQSKQQLAKDDGRTGKSTGRTAGTSTNERELLTHASEGRQGGASTIPSSVTGNGNSIASSTRGPISSTRVSDLHGNELKAESIAAKSTDMRASLVKDDSTEAPDVSRPSSSRLAHSPRQDNPATASKSSDKQPKRSSPAEEPDRQSKRRKGEGEAKDMEGEVRVLDKERSIELRSADLEKSGTDDHSASRVADKSLDRSKDKSNERYDRDYRDRLERPDKSRVDEMLGEKPRDRSMERYGRERSVERVQERGSDRGFDRHPDKSKDDRSKLRYNDLSKDADKSSVDKSHAEERFHMQGLPPPPPLPPHLVPQSVNTGRRDEDADRRFGTSRHSQRLSPRHEEKERRRSEENLASQDEAKRRREEELRERKRDEWEGMPMKVDERERDKEKANLLKEDIDASASSKRRKLKREHLPPVEPGEYSPVAPPPPLLGAQQPYDGRDRGDRKGAMIQRGTYLDEPGLRIHGKEVASKMTRRETDQMYDREWDEEKRQRAEQKRRHRK